MDGSDQSRKSMLMRTKAKATSLFPHLSMSDDSKHRSIYFVSRSTIKGTREIFETTAGIFEAAHVLHIFKMSRFIIKCLNDNNLEAAVQRVMRDGTKMISFTRLQSIKCENATYMMAQVLHIKRGTATRMPTSAGVKIRKVEIVFDRIILLREIRDGSLFYIKCKTREESNIIFQKQSQRWIGAFVLVNEPVYTNNHRYGVPIIETACPFLPVIPDWVGMKIVQYSQARVREGDRTALFAIVSDIALIHQSIQSGCGSAGCDGAHPNTKTCFTMDVRVATYLCVFSCRVSSAEMNISGVKYLSRNLGTYFMHQDYLTMGEDVMWDEDVLRHHVTLVLRHYQNAGVKWIIAGWTKLSHCAESSVAVSRVFHLSLVKPERRLHDAPIMQPPSQNPSPHPQVRAVDNTADAHHHQQQQQQGGVGEELNIVGPPVADDEADQRPIVNDEPL
uniref:uncharacterized protein isoform X2 n=1 Tax=Myxine glutinosa TaxID=7769 RepID=UPI00358F5C6F